MLIIVKEQDIQRNNVARLPIFHSFWKTMAHRNNLHKDLATKSMLVVFYEQTKN